MKRQGKRKKNLQILVLVIIIEFLVILSLFITIKKMTVEKPEIQLNTIQTKTLDLVYGDFSIGNVKANIADKKITFIAETERYSSVELFSIILNDKGENVLGTVVGKGNKLITIGLEMNKFEGEMEEAIKSRLNQTRLDMLDCIISNLEFEDGPFPLEENVNDVFLEENFVIITDYVSLYYPKVWREHVEIKEESESVTFYCQLPERNPIEVFSIQFDVEEEAAIGLLDDVPLGIITNDEVSTEDWTEEEKEIFYSMKEDSSIIIDGLLKYNNFVLR